MDCDGYSLMLVLSVCLAVNVKVILSNSFNCLLPVGSSMLNFITSFRTSDGFFDLKMILSLIT